MWPIETAGSGNGNRDRGLGDTSSCYLSMTDEQSILPIKTSPPMGATRCKMPMRYGAGGAG